jgi:hypothetical protein
MTEKRQTSQGYIIRILQHFATKLRNITNFVMLFQAVMKFLSRLVYIKISLKRGKFYYSRQNKDEIYPPVLIDGQPVRKVTSVKLLGLTLNSNLTWNNHVEYLVKSAFRKLYFLIQLKRSGVDIAEIVQYYCACIRSTLDYACPVFHYALPIYLREDLERI